MRTGLSGLAASARKMLLALATMKTGASVTTASERLLLLLPALPMTRIGHLESTASVL